MQYRIFLIFFCLFTLSSCQLFSRDPVKSFEIKKNAITQELPATAFQDSLDLDKNFINNFRLDGFTEQGETSVYLTEKKKLEDAYLAGDRSLNTLRAAIYLTSLEGDFSRKSLLEEEFCTLFSALCQGAISEVVISGLVTDSSSEPLVGALVEVLGSDKKVFTDEKGTYSFTFDAITPSVIRIRASYGDHMIDVEKRDLSDVIRKTKTEHNFVINFSLDPAYGTYDIDTKKKTITGTGAQSTSRGYEIVTPFTKYLIPYDAIVSGTDVYQGKVKVSVFEFDRTGSGTLLESDAFDAIEGFSTSLLVTYGMPFIIFSDEDGNTLDVLSTNPMKIATTLRERDDFMKTSNFDILYKMALDESRKNPENYPIDNVWLFKNGNLRIMPPFWVFDRMTGYWDNVGFRYVTANPESPYNIEAPFYTKKAQ